MLEKLLIKAETLEDSDIISSLVQDSIFHITYHAYHEDKKCLRLMLNRFCWELVDKFDEHQCYYRVHAGLYIHAVESISVNSNFMRSRGYLNLLAMHASDKEVNILFSENKHICVNISKVQIYLKDLHEKQPTLIKPAHAC